MLDIIVTKTDKKIIRFMGKFLFFCAASILISIQVKAASFQGLGILPGGYYSYATAISPDGSMVVGNSDVAGFYWTANDGMKDLSDLTGNPTTWISRGVSTNGAALVGQYTSSSGLEAYRWTEETGVIGLGDLPGGEFNSTAYSVSNDGSVVIGRSQVGDDLTSPSFMEAFRWTESGGIEGLGYLPDSSRDYSWAFDVSADGTVIVGMSSSSTYGEEAFRWTEDQGMVGLGVPEGEGWTYSQANSVSADGSTVVGYCVDDSYFNTAFLWTESAGMVSLGSIPSRIDVTNAKAVSGDGSVVVGISGEIYPYDRPFIWDESNGMQSLEDVLIEKGLDLNGWYLREATDISDDGMTIIGNGINPDGIEEAWIVTMGCDLNPKFIEGTLEEGIPYYTDSDYTFIDVPERYEGMQMIKTPNDDQNLTMASVYITFKMPYNGYVFVAYADTAEREPDWLEDFDDTGDFLRTALAISPAYRLYSKKYDIDECVNLGGNKGPGFVGGDEVFNYIVLYHPVGSLAVTLTPEDAVTAGAQWRVDDGQWHNSGDTQPDVLAGSHTVEFTTLSGWTNPEIMTVTVNGGETTTENAAYSITSQPITTGALQVTISPPEAVSAGAQWRVDDGQWYNSGDTQPDVPAGSHTVEFSTLSGWTNPEIMTVTVNEGETTTENATYSITSQPITTGALQVTISPPEAVSAGAQWRVDGGSWHPSGDTQSDLGVGSHTIECMEISGWITPNAQEVTIDAGQTMIANGLYEENAVDSTEDTPSGDSGGGCYINALIF